MPWGGECHDRPVPTFHPTTIAAAQLPQSSNSCTCSIQFFKASVSGRERSFQRLHDSGIAAKRELPQEETSQIRRIKHHSATTQTRTKAEAEPP